MAFIGTVVQGLIWLRPRVQRRVMTTDHAMTTEEVSHHPLSVDCLLDTAISMTANTVGQRGAGGAEALKHVGRQQQKARSRDGHL